MDRGWGREKARRMVPAVAQVSFLGRYRSLLENRGPLAVDPASGPVFPLFDIFR